MQETTISTLVEARSQGAVLIDVRETEEYVEAHVPGAVHIPLSQLGIRTDDVPRSDDPIYVICRSGQRSKIGAEVLEAHGIAALSVRGGTLEWIESGHPVVAGSERG